MRQELKVKEWVIDKAQEVAKNYNIYISYSRRDEEFGTPTVEDGYNFVIGDILAETEKAIKVNLESGEVVGSYKGWTTWIPKSQVIL